MATTVDEIRHKLVELQDEKYKAFQCKLIPTVDPETVIGIRTPVLRNFAKEIPVEAAKEFMQNLPHEYYDENNLHGFLIAQMKDFGEITAELDRFLPFVDNWATCDLISPKAYKKHLPELMEKIKEWIASDKTYTLRFGIEMLMTFYLDGEFLPEYLEMVAPLRSDEYYINMMIAWFFATALAKQYNATIPYIQSHRLKKWTHNKTIQKAIESYRITDEQKTYLKSLKM